MNVLYFLLFGMLVGEPASTLAQPDSSGSAPSHTIRHSFPEYDEEIMYFGKRDQYFTVRISQKNGLLYRMDSYTLLPKTLPNGFPLDSISRILHHGPTKIMYLTGNLYVSCEYKENILHGPFIVLYEDGAVKRKEYYRNGRITKSQCFTPDGSTQPCEPFYQVAQFQGKPADLSTYLKQKLESVVDGFQIRQVHATLTINEIGQITKVSVVVNTDPSARERVPVVGYYVQQIIRNMPEWIPDQLNWKPAVNDGKPTASTCVLSVFRAYGSMQYNLSYRM